MYQMELNGFQRRHVVFFKVSGCVKDMLILFIKKKVSLLDSF